MTEYRSLEDDSSQFFSIRKKTAVTVVLLSILSLFLASYILIQKGLWIGFVEPPAPAPPLSSELVSRFTELEEKLNKTISDVNEVFTLKEKLDKQQPTPKNPNLVGAGKGGQFLPLKPLNLSEEEYETNTSLSHLELAIQKINSSIPFLKKYLMLAMYFQNNLPDGVPLLGEYALSSGYGERKDPFTGLDAFHSGVDFAAALGTPIVSISNGRITKIGSLFDLHGYGKYIEITHDNGVVSKYGHLGDIYVSEKQTVKKGELIALVGNTGRSTGPHLHFEVHLQSKAVDPMGIISPLRVKPNPVAMAAIDTEIKGRCAGLLLIVKDENAPLMKECLATAGKRANDLLIARQSTLMPRGPSKGRYHLEDICSYVDSDGKLQIGNDKDCRSSANKEN